MKPRRVPIRMCVVCRQTSDKRVLLRVVRRPGDNGLVMFDLSGKANGRGAYVCANTECTEKAIKQKRFERSLNVSELPGNLADDLKAAAASAHSAGVDAL